jgi:hypothetical protein
MPTLQEERENLNKVDQDIADSERRVIEQIRRIVEMDRHGMDTRDAREMLQLLEDTLEQWRLHQQAILDEIARLTVP